MAMSDLAIIAGQGDLPKQLADHCERIGRAYHIVQFNGVSLDWVANKSVIPAQYEKPARLFKQLKSLNCKQVVFAGGMQRPKLNPLKFDLKMMGLATTLLPALKTGDDNTLRMIAGIFEGEGFEIVPAHDLLNNLLNNAGALGAYEPSEQDNYDIKRGLEVLKAMASADVGQACVVGQGLCLGMEAIQGSDAMLKFVSETKDKFLPEPDGAKGVFIKAPKQGQDNRMDMPTIGPDTINSVAQANLAGIALAMNGVQIIDQDKCITLANELGVFITVVE